MLNWWWFAGNVARWLRVTQFGAEPGQAVSKTVQAEAEEWWTKLCATLTGGSPLSMISTALGGLSRDPFSLLCRVHSGEQGGAVALECVLRSRQRAAQRRNRLLHRGRRPPPSLTATDPSSGVCRASGRARRCKGCLPRCSRSCIPPAVALLLWLFQASLRWVASSIPLNAFGSHCAGRTGKCALTQPWLCPSRRLALRTP